MLFSILMSAFTRDIQLKRERLPDLYMQDFLADISLGVFTHTSMDSMCTSDNNRI